MIKNTHELMNSENTIRCIQFTKKMQQAGLIVRNDFIDIPLKISMEQLRLLAIPTLQSNKG